jgi:hypothetical protein
MNKLFKRRWLAWLAPLLPVGMFAMPFAFASAQVTLPGAASLPAIQAQIVQDRQALNDAEIQADNAGNALRDQTVAAQLADFRYGYVEDPTYAAYVTAHPYLTSEELSAVYVADHPEVATNLDKGIYQTAVDYAVDQRAADRAHEHLQYDANEYRAALYNAGLPEPEYLPFAGIGRP